MTALGDDTAGARLAATILLTLPGVPFVYYGEEIGMTGDKPDERLRTPMQWAQAPAAGFTSGKAWEALQPDSFKANVAVEDQASNSLLKLYRWLIRLRANDTALREGRLEPIDTGNESLLAYLRKDGSSQVLVVVNLGKVATTLALPGNFTLRSLLTPGRNRTALPKLEPRTAYIYEMTPRP
jgi:glycosidase